MIPKPWGWRSHYLPLRKGQKVEIAILAVDEDEELEQLRADLAMRGVTEVLPNQLAD